MKSRAILEFATSEVAVVDVAGHTSVHSNAAPLTWIPQPTKDIAQHVIEN